MSLQKGKFYRRAQPYTASNNWDQDSKPPYRMAPWIRFEWSGGVLVQPADVISDPYDLDLHTLTFKWKIAFSMGLFNFGAGVKLAQIPGTPTNRIELTMLDDFASLLVATWDLDPDVWEWNYAEFLLGPPTAFTATGFFGPTDFAFGPWVVPYFLEP